MRISTDFDKPGYWHQGAMQAETMHKNVAARTGLPVETVALVYADFFAHVYMPPEDVTADESGVTVLDQWGQGVCVSPDGSFHHVGG